MHFLLWDLKITFSLFILAHLNISMEDISAYISACLIIVSLNESNYGESSPINSLRVCEGWISFLQYLHNQKCPSCHHIYGPGYFFPFQLDSCSFIIWSIFRPSKRYLLCDNVSWQQNECWEHSELSDKFYYNLTASDGHVFKAWSYLSDKLLMITLKLVNYFILFLCGVYCITCFFYFKFSHCRIRERKESVTVLLCGTSGCGKSTLSALLVTLCFLDICLYNPVSLNLLSGVLDLG